MELISPVLGGPTLALAVLILDRLEVNSKSFSKSSWLTELDAMPVMSLYDNKKKKKKKKQMQQISQNIASPSDISVQIITIITMNKKIQKFLQKRSGHLNKGL